MQLTQHGGPEIIFEGLAILSQGAEPRPIDRAQFEPPQAVRAWVDTLSPAPELQVLHGAGHFFHGRLNELRDVVLAFMARSA